jgi:hypothetical protein
LNGDLAGKSIWQIKSYSGHYFDDAKGNKERVHSVRLKTFNVGGFDLGNDIKVGWMEMKEEEFLGAKNERMPVLGNIGVDILQQYHAIIDFGNHKLYLQR